MIARQAQNRASIPLCPECGRRHSTENCLSAWEEEARRAKVIRAGLDPAWFFEKFLSALQKRYPDKTG